MMSEDRILKRLKDCTPVGKRKSWTENKMVGSDW